MIFKSSSLVAAAAAITLSSAAFTASAGTILADPVTGPSFNNLMVGTINVASLSDLSGSIFAATNVTFPAPFNFTLSLDGVTLSSGTVGALAGDLDPTAAGFMFKNVAAGNYIVKASGALDGLGQYKGLALIGANYTVTAVPEPETYALMLAGLVAVTFLARRRSV